jgi:hypothetical protein
MTASGWTIPIRLQRLVESGWWPHDEAAAMKQNLHPLVTETQVRAFASDESTIFFLPPPFHTVSDLLASNERYWTSEMACPAGISFDHCVVIGDFGLGSDAPILLDYRTDALRPSILRLCFGETFAQSRWVKAAEDFDAMCEILHIDQHD